MCKRLIKIINSPVRLLFTSWSFVIFIYLVSPISYNNDWEFKTIIFVLAFFVLFATGYLFGKQFVKVLIINKYHKHNKYNHVFKLNIFNNLRQFTRFIALLGLIGSSMLAIDLLFFRGVDYTQGLSIARTSLQTNVLQQGGIPVGHPWSILARILSGFSPIAALIAILRIEQFNMRSLLIVLFSLIVQFFSDTLSGGRNLTFMTLVLLGMAILLRLIQGKIVIPKRFKSLITIQYLIVFSFVGYALFIFIDREQTRGRNLLESYINIESSWLLTISPQVTSFAESEGLISVLIFALVYLSVYITHSLSELNLLLSQSPEPGLFYGFNSLYLLTIFLEKMGFISENFIVEIQNSLARSGVYLSMLGTWYVDFGYILSLFMFLGFGLVTGFIWKLFKLTKKLYLEMICSYILLTLAISPFYFSLSTGNGLQTLFALIISGSYISLSRLNRQ